LIILATAKYSFGSFFKPEEKKESPEEQAKREKLEKERQELEKAKEKFV